MARRRKRFLLWAVNAWPPFLGAGIRVTRIDPQLRAIDVEMKLRFWNRNYVGTHYGGSLYSMTDPFFMLMLIENLGRDYIVWDKAATIRFRKPGRGRVHAAFRLSEERLQEIRVQADAQGKCETAFSVEVKDESGDVVAVIEKTIYVRNRVNAAHAA